MPFMPISGRTFASVQPFQMRDEMDPAALKRCVGDLQKHLGVLDAAGEDRAAMYIDAAIIELAPKLGAAGASILREQRQRAIDRARRR
jgi:hypothetical protein